MSDVDEATLLQFLQTANWDVLLSDREIRSIVLELKKKSDASGGDDVSSAIRIKLVVVGDGAVGKTSLLISYTTDNFPEGYVPTVFENYTAQMKLNDKPILLHLWDTAGQEDYDRLRPLSYPGADLILLCFSLCHKPSLESVKVKWYPEVRHHIPDVPQYLVGTKLDLKEHLTQNPNPDFELVSSEEGKAMCEEINALKYIEISAKTRTNLEFLFQESVSTVLEMRRQAAGGADGSGSEPGSSSSGSSTAPSNKNSKEKCVLQ